VLLPRTRWRISESKPAGTMLIPRAALDSELGTTRPQHLDQNSQIGSARNADAHLSTRALQKRGLQKRGLQKRGSQENQRKPSIAAAFSGHAPFPTGTLCRGEMAAATHAGWPLNERPVPVSQFAMGVVRRFPRATSPAH
jgi:hypothetical protein